MTLGMMWLMNKKRVSVAEEIDKAADHYARKYGVAPTRCHINPVYMAEDSDVDGIDIVLDGNIAEQHIWLGLPDEEAN